MFTPASPLAPHTTYTVELGPDVRRAGDPGQVAAGRSWTFTTGGQTASAQNQVAFLSPRGGIRNVIAGTLLIGILLNGMTIMNIQYNLQNVIRSLILLIAIVIDSLLNPRDEQIDQQGDI